MRFLILVLICSYSLSIFAQAPCGAIEPESSHFYDRKVLQTEVKRLNESSKMNPRVFMVALFVIRNDAGLWGISDDEVLDAIDHLNDVYIKANIKFELCDKINYIDNSSFLKVDPVEVSWLTENYNIDNVINVYFTSRIIDNKGRDLCGAASFPNASNYYRKIVMDNDCVNNGSTLIHEFGHFFGLRHTHSKAGGKEQVERINCGITGDGFCDTPADPKLDKNNVEDCIYVGDEVDENNDLYTPEVRNYMSYGPKSCRNLLSDEQWATVSLTAFDANSYLLNACNLSDLFQQKSNLYPNPSEDVLNLYLSDDSRGLSYVSIYSTSGKLIRTSSFEKDVNLYVYTLDVSNFTRGYYFLHILNRDGEEANFKFLKL